MLRVVEFLVGAYLLSYWIIGCTNATALTEGCMKTRPMLVALSYCRPSMLWSDVRRPNVR